MNQARLQDSKESCNQGSKKIQYEAPKKFKVQHSKQELEIRISLFSLLI